ncbi:hypothetical protein FRC08_002044 [Ceratobasidium sp. 394]|nr:hypothetical protein FRC08_002044 [Ceratobasidium sp. 394]KAG9101390.1 hypothetical protein FS749_007478 [Ceratobasidium sp. UAMH 11750]
MSDGSSHNLPYHASRSAALLFTGLFALALFAHIGQAIQGRCKYVIPILVATVLETIGYVFRYLAIKKPTQQWPLISSEIFIIVAPGFFMASEYMIFGRIMAYVGSEHSLIRPIVITKVFVGASLLTIFTQVAGGALINANNTSLLRTGRSIIIGGLAAQIVAFAIFMVLAVAFDLRTRRRLGSDVQAVHPLIRALYVSGVLIMIRGIYRAIEFSQIRFTTDSAKGYIANHEWLFYVFDSLLVLVATVILYLVHPAVYIPNGKGLRMDGTTYEFKSGSWSSGQRR